MQEFASAPLPLRGTAAPKTRRGQLVGFGMLWLLVLLGALGVLGNGPLNGAVSQQEGVRVEYERVLHLRASAEFRIAASPVGPRLRLEIESIDPAELELEPLVPEPTAQLLTARGAVFDFAARSDEIQIALRETPRRIGLRKVRILVDHGEPVWIRQLILP
jgi:hypothetical protein